MVFHIIFKVLLFVSVVNKFTPRSTQYIFIIKLDLAISLLRGNLQKKKSNQISLQIRYELTSFDLRGVTIYAVSVESVIVILIVSSHTKRRQNQKGDTKYD